MQTRNGLIVFDLGKLKAPCTEYQAILEQAKKTTNTSSFDNLISHLSWMIQVCSRGCDTQAGEKDLVSAGATLKTELDKTLNSNRRKSLFKFTSTTNENVINAIREKLDKAFYEDLEFLSSMGHINNISLYKIYESINGNIEKTQPDAPNNKTKLDKPDAAHHDFKPSDTTNKLMTRGGLTLLDGDEFKKMCDNYHKQLTEEAIPRTDSHQKKDDITSQLLQPLQDMSKACMDLSKTNPHSNTQISEQERQNYEYICMRGGIRLKEKFDGMINRNRRRSQVGSMKDLYADKLSLHSILTDYCANEDKKPFRDTLKFLESLTNKNTWKQGSTPQSSPRSQNKRT